MHNIFLLIELAGLNVRVHFCVCMQQGVRKQLFQSSAQYFGPSQIPFFQRPRCEKDKEEEPESFSQMFKVSNDQETKTENHVKRLKMTAAFTNPYLEGDKPFQTCNTPIGGGRNTEG